MTEVGQRGRGPLVGCILLSGALGTVHAWSIFLEPLESRLDAGRGTISAAYSVALVAITVTVLLGHRLFSRLPAWAIAGLTATGSAAGLLITAAATSWSVLLLGYGMVFGLANGLGYAFALQRSAEANPGSAGKALGLTTAAYALGAALAAILLDGPIRDHGPAYGLRLLALVVGLAGLAAVFLVGSGRSASVSDQKSGLTDWRVVRGLWTSYGLAVLAGLMVMGHAAAIVDEAGGPGGITVSMAGFASAAGGVWMSRMRLNARQRLLVALPAASAGALMVGGLAPQGGNGAVAVTMVVIVALIYGAIIALYPAVVYDRFGVAGYPSAYGKLFTGWGAAGLVGP
ncbi:MAG: MFS transporter, partial [Actinomycetota bacterium]|nr:MFS transporter [Actinomycetota bacterium]